MEKTPVEENNNPGLTPEVKTESGENKSEIIDPNEEAKKNLLEIKEEPQVEIKTEEDLERINVNSDKLEINDLKSEKIFQKLKNLTFPKLQILSLNGVGIKSLEFTINPNFKSMVILELKNNEIESLNKISEAPFKDLQVLDLSNNKIKSIDDISKAPFKEIQIIALSENEISDIKPITTQEFPNLKKLDLSYNKIKSIESLKDYI